MTTTNGTKAIVAARTAPVLITAALTNAAAAAARLLAAGRDVTLLCSGSDGDPSFEDTLGCGAVLHALQQLTEVTVAGDPARMALALFAACRDRLPAVLADTHGGRHIRRVPPRRRHRLRRPPRTPPPSSAPSPTAPSASPPDVSVRLGARYTSLHKVTLSKPVRGRWYEPISRRASRLGQGYTSPAAAADATRKFEIKLAVRLTFFFSRALINEIRRAWYPLPGRVPSRGGVGGEPLSTAPRRSSQCRSHPSSPTSHKGQGMIRPSQASRSRSA